jgi:hypothetical protein
MLMKELITYEPLRLAFGHGGGYLYPDSLTAPLSQGRQHTWDTRIGIDQLAFLYPGEPSFWEFLSRVLCYHADVLAIMLFKALFSDTIRCPDCVRVKDLAHRSQIVAGQFFFGDRTGGILAIEIRRFLKCENR